MTEPLTRVWLAISGHGHGHLVQVTPLIRALQARYPELVLAVQSSLPPALLQQTFGDAVQLHPEAVDVGMVMSGPLTVLPEESLAAYRQVHRSWPEHLAAQVALFDVFRPDLVIGDIPYLPLAAAKACSVPAVAVCSLNWADVLEHYCAGDDGAEEIIHTIRQHYAAADLFLRPMPAMPMDTLSNTVETGPLISVGQSRRAELQATLQLPAGHRIVLLTLGGIAGRMDISQWPEFANTVFLVPAIWLPDSSGKVDSCQFNSIESTGMPFADLFASCDALITKPGYGAFVGAGCCGLPVLYTERGDWPEEPYLVQWLEQVGRVLRISREALENGEFAPALDELLAQARMPSAKACGAAEGLALIDALFR